MSDAAGWRALVDLDRLAGWMDGAGLGGGPIERVEPLAGGTQNVMLRLWRGGREFVLRRPPAHPRADGNRTLRREAAVLAALAGSRVPHPPLVALCDDPAVLGAVFYLMQPVDGFNPVNGLPEPHASSPALRRAMGFAMVDGLLALREVDARAGGLDAIGNPDGYLERQVPRWIAQLESYRDCAGWPGPAGIPHVDAVARWLDANRPRDFAPGLMHGDYHLANVMFRRDGPALAAIVDWELTTVGDPLVDLGWLLATWPGADGVGAGTIRVTPFDGFPTADELLADHAAKAGGRPAHADWYVVLAWFKLGILMEGTFARACCGKASKDFGAQLHASTLRLFERARATIAG